MGCDIHAHVEIKVKGKWLHYNHPRVDRNYNLFAKIAGVRNANPGDDDYIKPISEPKGLPPGLNETTKLDYAHDKPDAHSMSWLSSKELVVLSDWWDEQHKSDRRSMESVFGIEGEFGFLFGNGLAGFHNYPEERPKFLQDVRIVFWFDN